MPNRIYRWLKNTEAAKALAIDERTIKRWMRDPDRRAALGAVKHVTQWRIPRPDNLDHWRSDIRWRFEKLGVPLEPEWKHDLRKIAQNNRDRLEQTRFWLACNMTVLACRAITEQDKMAISLLARAFGKVKHKREIGRRLREMGLAGKEIGAAISYWPDEGLFQQVRAAHTLEDLEKIRRRLDYTEASRGSEQNGKEPTAENLLVHKDFMAHVNDTGEELPGIVVENPTPEDLEKMTLASVCDQLAPIVTLDFRQPQDGISLRTFRTRYPRRQQPQRDIIAVVYRITNRAIAKTTCRKS